MGSENFFYPCDTTKKKKKKKLDFHTPPTPPHLRQLRKYSLAELLRSVERIPASQPLPVSLKAKGVFK